MSLLNQSFSLPLEEPGMKLTLFCHTLLTSVPPPPLPPRKAATNVMVHGCVCSHLGSSAVVAGTPLAMLLINTLLSPLLTSIGGRREALLNGWIWLLKAVLFATVMFDDLNTCTPPPPLL